MMRMRYSRIVLLPGAVAEITVRPWIGWSWTLRREDGRWRVKDDQRHLAPTPLARKEWATVDTAKRDIRRAYRGEPLRQRTSSDSIAIR